MAGYLAFLSDLAKITLDNLAEMEANMEWQLADAKNRFSELVNQALRVGPQRVRRRNESVIVISADEYERLKGQTVSFKQYLLAGESLEGVDLTRDRSPMRESAL